MRKETITLQDISESIAKLMKGEPSPDEITIAYIKLRKAFKIVVHPNKKAKQEMDKYGVYYGNYLGDKRIKERRVIIDCNIAECAYCGCDNDKFIFENRFLSCARCGRILCHLKYKKRD